MSAARAGNDIEPCEDTDINLAFKQVVQAGDRLKVGWLSGNRAGGYVRLALAPITSPLVATTFDNNVLKTTCFGHNEFPGLTVNANCNHPCNARGGCSFASGSTDVERYDTTVGIPYNLAPGEYVMQFKAYIGNSDTAVFSCSRLQINGGDPSMSCAQSATIPYPSSCYIATAPGPDVLLQNSALGNFCFDPEAPSDVDATSNRVPVNVDCDPRVGCDPASNPVQCTVNLGTTTILSPSESPHVASCTMSASPAPTRSARPIFSSTTLPVSVESSTNQPIPIVPTTTVDVVIPSTSLVDPTTTTNGIIPSTLPVEPTTTFDIVIPITSEASQATSSVDGVVPTTGSPQASSPAIFTTSDIASPVSSVVQPLPTEVVYSTSVPSCISNPIIDVNTDCDVDTAPITCSGSKVARCACKMI